MKKFSGEYVPKFVIFALSVALAPVFRAQNLGTVTRITPVPADAQYAVDGQLFTGPSSAIWAPQSNHVLSVPTPGQSPRGGVRYTFTGWATGTTTWTLNPLPVVATPAIPEYKVMFDVSYALGVSFYNCSDPPNCKGPGSVWVNGVQYNSSADIYLPANSVANLWAVPNPGYVFAGWQPIGNQTSVAAQSTITMTSPFIVRPQFLRARRVNLATNPPGLTVLADRAPTLTPASTDWGVGTTHSVGANSPQRDAYGKWWAFQSWSDGGGANHDYHVVEGYAQETLTAKYGPAALVSILPQPAGIRIKVDGQYNAINPYYFAWGIGEKHHLEAPEQQADSQGRVWKFKSWSNGGSATQDIIVPAGADLNGLRLTAAYTSLTGLTVNSSLPGLTVNLDGVACVTPCTVYRTPGAQVKVSAPPSVSLGDGARADFDGWPGTTGDLTVTLGSADVTMSANYHLLNRLTAVSDPVDGAAWTVAPPSPDGFYRTNVNVALTVAPQPGYKFRRWDGDLSGTFPSGVVTMSAPRVVKALLVPVPYIAPAGVVNAAGPTPQAGVAPGGILSIFGANLSTQTVVAPDGILPQTLGGLTVQVGERLLPLYFVSPQQVNAQVPDDLAIGDQVLTVSPEGAPSVRAAFTVVRNAPGLFPVAASGGQAMAMAFHEDGSPVTADAPAKSGELLTVYGTGFGPAERPRPEGMPIPQSTSFAILDAVTVQVGEAVISAEKAYATAGRCGIDTVQFRLDGSVTGTVTFRVTVNGVASNTLLLPVQ